MGKSDLTDLSRITSHALRHEPETYGLKLDADGWVSMESLVAALRRRGGRWRDLTPADLSAMVLDARKQRHEIKDGRIRALYGHSIAVDLARRPLAPPAVLYHATTPDVVPKILADGLRPMGRNFVHLAIDRETATRTAKRKTRTPVLLAVDARRARSDGVAFYAGNDLIWLAAWVPADYLDPQDPLP